MKKQILSTMMLILTFVIAGYNVNAQTGAVHNTNARPITCETGPLKPLAGVPYNYSATVNPAGGVATWFATTSPKFIENNQLLADSLKVKGDQYILDETNLGENLNSESNTNVGITWNTIGLSNVDYTSGPVKPLFVGIMYDAATDNCANNIQVWKIEPVNGFTLDITNVDGSGTPQAYGTNVIQCFDEVVSAAYDFTSNAVNMDYGTQTLYYEVIAANFTNKFNAKFQLEGLETGQEATISWGYSPSADTEVMTLTDDSYGPIEALTNETNTSNGVSIYVKVEIANNHYEGLDNQIITLRVDGTDAAGNEDVKPECIPESAFSDYASQTITARPDISDPTPSPFAPKN